MKLKIVFTLLLLVIISCNNNSQVKNNSFSKDFIFHEPLEISNQEANDYYLKGLKEIQRQNYEQGKKYFLEADKIEPENLDILNCIANADKKLGNHTEAEEMYNQIIRADEGYVYAYINLSSLYLSEKNYEDSKNTLLLAENLIKNFPTKTNFAFYANLVKSYSGLKEYDKALKINKICKNYAFSEESENHTEIVEVELKKLIKKQ